MSFPSTLKSHWKRLAVLVLPAGVGLLALRRGLKLHYMTAREAYNVVKAAEDGQTGNPEDYRDWRIPRPLNVAVPRADVSDQARH